MGRLLEEKAGEYRYEHHHRLPCSLKEKVSVLFDEDLDESSVDGSRDDSETNGSDSINPTEERTLYWESQDVLLQEILERYSSATSKLREEINRIVTQARKTNVCSCLKPSSEGCVSCLRRGAVNLLCQKGFKANLCTSKWKHTKKFPGGRHEYIEVVGNTKGRKDQVGALVIELELREQFEIAKAGDEYRRLINQLPELYIGKSKYLQAIAGVVCGAAERCMKERKIHMGPWRKMSFVQMKWSNSLEPTLLP